MNITRERGSHGRLFRENIKTFLNVTFGMIPDSVDQMLAGMMLVYSVRFVIKCGVHMPVIFPRASLQDFQLF